VNRPITLDEEYSYPLHTVGTASGSYQEDQADDVVSRLHQVVKEVTGVEVERPQKPRIGFLP
jgi:hypothetical protein